jgi:cysteine synthase A
MLDRVRNRPGIGWECLESLIGRTPLVRLDLRCEGRDITVYAKIEMFNLSGSIKDRMALMILKRAAEAGELEFGQPIAEATSGNAGIAIAAIGRAIGCPVTIFMPDWMSLERQALLRSFGAELRLVSKEEGGFLGSIAMAEAMGKEQGAFLTRQFSNTDNCRAHFLGTGPELIEQVDRESGQIGAFVAGVGTGGTVMGVGQCLKQLDASISVHPIEPAQSPTLSTGYKVGSHRIQGISDEFVPDIVKLDRLDDVVAVCDSDAISMAQWLCREAGLGVGISSGANLVGAIKVAMAKGDGKPVATVFADSNMRYLSTDLAHAQSGRAGDISDNVELIGMRVIPGVHARVS